ncbi:hypothetical protein PISMIDRAFT_680904 [Pisolithus microcarpus 441]|uniref:Uncharacterized protein n=1 Tax=Pisolithus microcarpus 441 TaxID=765257 RepID=A0A0C9ZHJ5_9AGAM|nr:hypothetical protein PISMIDRAFT_680904 [Pisolithus microcarpus 441]
MPFVTASVNAVNVQMLGHGSGNAQPCIAENVNAKGFTPRSALPSKLVNSSADLQDAIDSVRQVQHLCSVYCPYPQILGEIREYQRDVNMFLTYPPVASAKPAEDL